ncbi:MAG: dicarboxylate/amino acid:cation symporter [Gammaproteobacteria bacterium]
MSEQHSNRLLWAMLAGVVGGATAGTIIGQPMVGIEWIGTLFLNALKMTIIPLVIAAVITGVASLGDVRKLGKIGGYTLGYYASTTAVAVLIGLAVVNIVEPGAGITSADINADNSYDATERAPIGFSDIVLSAVSPNLVAAAAETQLLPIIVFSLVFAAALTTLGAKGEPTLKFFESLNHVMMKMINWIMYLAPIGIFALIASRLGKAGGGMAFLHEAQAIGGYVIAVLVGLAIHSVFLFSVLRLLTGKGLDFLRHLSQALFTAFGTASSSATLPLTISGAKSAGVDDRAVRFVLPIGATINMDGTALYEAIAVMFIAQVYGIEMGVMEQTIIFVTATLAAIGAAGIPQAGLVTMVIVLSAVNLPLEGIALILSVDWFLDRFRTVINVWGDSVGSALVSRVMRS